MSRVHYPGSRVEVKAEAGGALEPFECDDAEVWIEGRSILISYFDGEGMVVLDGGPGEGPGWILFARSRPWRAFLNPMSEAPGHFVGEIDELGEVATWRLCLGEPDER
ncbi:MAG: hypothetical protein GY910_04420 [bacterium]|nr:hypothetical protein [Deltaproteobacteria bacterium]MCP4904204.1 hypothetical protein [bacterium]